ncbi:conserved hypothetical protein [Vibrio chagasii]|nr:conserved hypothetical protein [Vibrio chagasii]
MISSELLSMSIGDQMIAMDRFSADEYRAQRHVSGVHLKHEYCISPDSYRQADDPNYREPTLEEINDVADQLLLIFSKKRLSKMLGIDTGSNKTRQLNRWTTGESKIPYVGWRMLLIVSGRVSQFFRVPDTEGSSLYELDGGSEAFLILSRENYVKRLKESEY